MKGKQISIRLTDAARILLDKTAKKLGLSKTAVLEIAIRRVAELENVK